jgi:hypothetical protein
MKTFARRTLFLLPLACAALYGCPSQESVPSEEEYADVIYGGEATDEAMVALGSAIDQKAPAEDPAQAPALDSPAAGELPKTPIPEFKWHFGAGSARAPAFTTPSFALALQAGALKTGAPSFQRALAELFGPPRAAGAHGDPLNGPATFLVFATKADAKLVRVLTDQTSYTPSQEAWDKLAAAGTDITLTLIGAQFDNNRVADGGGPFKGTVLTFTIAP